MVRTGVAASSTSVWDKMCARGPRIGGVAVRRVVTVKCEQCGANVRETRLATHLRKHHQSSKVKCEKCGGWNNTTTLKEYVLPDRKIGIWAGGFDNGSFCGIFFQQTGPSVADRGCRVHEFRTLISARDPNFTHPRYAESVETAKRHIRNYAKALRVFAEDAILGDYSFFER